MVAWALVAGGCYTNPINRVPAVAIEPVGEVFRGQMASFMATASDPDGDAVTLSWAVRLGACPNAGDVAARPPVDRWAPLEDARRFQPPVPLTNPSCVWVLAKDSHGAIAADNQDVILRNRAPVAAVQLSSPDLAASYPLYTSFVLTGERSLDPEGDPILFDWSLTAPSGHGNPLDFCDAARSEDARCFVADVPGRYVVALTATEAGENPASSEPATITLDVLPDRAPCIAMTDPPFSSFWDGDPTKDAAFTVTRVDDDGDQQEIHFKWFYARPDQVWTFIDNDFPQLNIKADSFQLGDKGEVRVEIRDRANQEAIDNALLGCGDAPVCAAQANPGCFQRVTWKVEWSL